MRVFVAGATGAIGRPLVKELVSRGHQVAALARSEENERVLRSLGAEPRRADLFDASSLAKAAEGAEAVIRTATHIPTSTKPKGSDWATNDRIRRDGTRALLEAAAKVGARHYLQESITWLARPNDGRPFTESSPPNTDRITASALDAERIAETEGERLGLKVTTLRLGFLYGPEAAHLRGMAQGLKARRVPIVGKGDTPIGFLHLDDAATAFAAALEGGVPGLWHVVDDRPVPAGEFFEEFARRLGAPKPMHVPVWLARLAAGEAAVKMLTVPTVTSSAPFRTATGWAPRYPTIREGLAQMEQAWRAEGFLGLSRLEAAAPVAGR
ncbi:MAG TPA: NAD(P)H-binding protein [Candidatus Thermoplasmatota archaeon]|nr:NAD(P)H-binding protein [Candidatus Thermoplasmatota archaeon]